MEDETANDEDNAKLVVSELLDLLNDERACRDVNIASEIVRTVRLLVKQNDCRKQEVIAHPQVSGLDAPATDSFVSVDRLFGQVIQHRR